MLPRHVYVHVPFCARRCSYCDFAIAVRRTTPVAEYLEALRRELSLVRSGSATLVPSPQRDGQARSRDGDWPARSRGGNGAARSRGDDRGGRADAGWRVETLYIGGGTPSRLGGAGVRALLELLREHVMPLAGAEVTLEANPDDVTPAAAAAWREAGVTRLSLGAQSFDDAALRWMHRTHTAAQVEHAVAAARAAGIASLSVDLIFALPEVLERNWGADLRRTLALEPDHISLYGLTVEPGTPLGRWLARGVATEAPEERYEREFLAAHEVLRGAGFAHYEVSNYARAGHRARHNASYWRRVPYTGFGPGAHSFDGVSRRWNTGSYVEWRARLARGEWAVAGREELTAENRAAEEVYLGLRTSEGIAEPSGRASELERWTRAGWAIRSDGRLRLTASGWLRLDALAAGLTGVSSP